MKPTTTTTKTVTMRDYARAVSTIIGVLYGASRIVLDTFTITTNHQTPPSPVPVPVLSSSSNTTTTTTTDDDDDDDDDSERLRRRGRRNLRGFLRHVPCSVRLVVEHPGCRGRSPGRRGRKASRRGRRAGHQDR